MADPRLAGVLVGGDAAAWAEAGFTVGGSGFRLGTVDVHVHPAITGVGAWSLTDVDVDEIDGLATQPPAPAPVELPATHANGAMLLDHVVVTTQDLDRTTAALEGQGLVARRTRDAGAMKQRFFRMGEVLLELVGPSSRSGNGPATFWGLALTVADLDHAVALLGDRLGPVKAAVQPGRRIATLRHRELGLPCPVAFMSPDPPALS